MLPRVKIYYENGAIGGAEPQEDGISGMVANGVEVVDGMQLGTMYLLTKLADLTDIGVASADADANAHIYKQVKEFYDTAPNGTNLYLMAFADTVTLTDMLDVTNEYAKKLVDAANGKIRTLFVVRKEAAGYTPTIVDGLDGDVYTAISKAQALGNYAADSKYAPLFTIIEGRRYSGTASALADLSERADNRVAIVIGDTVSGSNNAAVGLLAGLIAAIPVQRSIMRVKTGAIKSDNLYTGTKAAEEGSPDVIHARGYITARMHVGYTGYWWTDDKLATGTDDDYRLIPRRRVIDKAYRLAYNVMVQELGDEIPILSDGTMPPAVVKDIQQKVEQKIITNMTVLGNLGNDPSDPNDRGVICTIDHKQNVVSTEKLEVQLRVKPYGYPKYIDVYLGFTTVTV